MYIRFTLTGILHDGRDRRLDEAKLETIISHNLLDFMSRQPSLPSQPLVLSHVTNFGTIRLDSSITLYMSPFFVLNIEYLVNFLKFPTFEFCSHASTLMTLHPSNLMILLSPDNRRVHLQSSLCLSSVSPLLTLTRNHKNLVRMNLCKTSAQFRIQSQVFHRCSHEHRIRLKNSHSHLECT